MQTKLLQIKTLSSTRVGAGRGLGHIDLPVVRERATNYPYIPGSSIKGVLKDAAYQNDPNFDVAFGKGGNDDQTHAGALAFTDARILALPILSFYGTFALVTCPTVLRRLKDDLEAFNYHNVNLPTVAPMGNQIFVKNDSVLKSDGKVYLLDVDFEAQNLNAGGLFSLFPALFDDARQKRFAIVSDEAFGFLCETGTEVNAHIRIQDDVKTVAKGGLWYEETLPAETILYGFVSSARDDELLNTFFPNADGAPKYIQFGGKASTGKGLCACVFKSLNQQDGGEQ